MCKCSSKAFLLLLGLVFWGISVVLAWISVLIFSKYHDFENMSKDLNIFVPAICLLICSVLFLIIGLIGCIASCREHKCLLGTLSVLLIFVGVALIVSGSLAYHYRYKVEDRVEMVLRRELHDYSSNNNEIDNIQSTFQCCGVYNYTDWKNTNWATKHNISYPNSCCSKYNCSDNKNLYKDGCISVLHDFIVKHLNYILIAAFGFLALIMLGVLATCVLLCYRKAREDDVPYTGLVPDGSRLA